MQVRPTGPVHFFINHVYGCVLTKHLLKIVPNFVQSPLGLEFLQSKSQSKSALLREIICVLRVPLKPAYFEYAERVLIMVWGTVYLSKKTGDYSLCTCIRCKFFVNILSYTSDIASKDLCSGIIYLYYSRRDLQLHKCCQNNKRKTSF